MAALDFAAFAIREGWSECREYPARVTESSRARRSDAVLNRERLLDAARAIFAEQGGGVPLEEIAKIAEVSRTTLYRNFATRDDLVAVILDENVTLIEQRSQELLAEGDDDAIITLFDFVFEKTRDDRSFTPTISTANLGWLTSLSERTVAAFHPLLEKGHKAGIVHPDVTTADIMMAFPMAEAAMRDDDASGRELMSDRVLALLHRALFTR